MGGGEGREGTIVGGFSSFPPFPPFPLEVEKWFRSIQC